MHLIFHHDDLDGYAAAAVVAHAITEKSLNDLMLVPINYHMALPTDILKHGDIESVNVVDFSFTDDDWDYLLRTGLKVTWIDHHKSAILGSAGRPWGELPGIRDEGTGAACVLAWRHYYPGVHVPLSLQLVSDRDEWVWSLGDITRGFFTFMNTAFKLDELRAWGDILFGSTADVMTSELADTGLSIDKAQAYKRRRYAHTWAFIAHFEGLKAAVLFGSRGSESFGDIASSVECLISVQYDGLNYTASIYPGGLNPGLDCMSIALKYGGGGHINAAGFMVHHQPWKLLYRVCDGDHAGYHNWLFQCSGCGFELYARNTPTLEPAPMESFEKYIKQIGWDVVPGTEEIQKKYFCPRCPVPD